VCWVNCHYTESYVHCFRFRYWFQWLDLNLKSIKTVLNPRNNDFFYRAARNILCTQILENSKYNSDVLINIISSNLTLNNLWFDKCC
jgi:hypothetical protein